METQEVLKHNFSEDFNVNEYYLKILEYSENYIIKLKEHYKLGIDNQECIVKIKQILKAMERPFKVEYNARNIQSDKKKSLRNIMMKHGFDIKRIYNQGLFRNWFYPEKVAILLVFYSLVNEIRENDLNLPKGLGYVSKLFGYTEYQLQMIRSYLKFVIEKIFEKRVGNFQYTNESFKNKLLEIMKKTSRIDIEMTLELFKMFDFGFKEFVEEVVRFKTKAKTSKFLSHLKDNHFCKERYDMIKGNLKKLKDSERISYFKYIEAINIVDQVSDTISKEIKHQLWYIFRYNQKKIRDINLDIQEKLIKFMERIETSDYPLDLFIHAVNPDQDIEKRVRGSNFFLKGFRKEHLRTKTIKKELIETLIKENKIKLSSNIAERLQEIARETIKETSGHEPIQVKAMLKMEEVFAVEIPIWYNKVKGKEVTGHIDFLGIENNKLIIIEYKPDNTQVIKSIAQVIVYAYLLSKTLEIDIDKIECINFSPDLIYSFKPEIIKDIISFIDKQNSKRENNLRCDKNSLKYTEIYTETYDFKRELTRISKFK